MTSSNDSHPERSDKAREQRIAEAAERALAEAGERRRAGRNGADVRPNETGGQAGPDPARYGDWEKDGIVSDF